MGSLGSSRWKRPFNKSDDRLRLDAIISLNSELFWDHFQQVTQKMKVKERPTLFVHGFNNTFEDSVRRAAQIGYDLGIGQGIGLFSWPSKGRRLRYAADERAAEASKYFLADFIEEFVENSTQKSINIIAHSMGCRCLLGSLEVLAKDRKHVLERVNQVILAAADVDTSIMPHLGPHAVRHCERTTSYVSDRDKALKLSGWLHSFPRVGVTPPTYILEGMDTVLVNDLDLGGFSHAYVSRSRTILSDIFNLLKHNSPPQDRHSIEERNNGAGRFWRIKD